MDLARRKQAGDRNAGGEAPAGVAARPGNVSARALLSLIAVAVVVYAADQSAKLWVVAELPAGKPVAVWGDILTFFFVRNSGAAFSLASGSTWIFSITASAVALFIAFFARRIRSLPWAILFGMLLGGTLGNLTDRLFRDPGFGVGRVVDFIQVKYFPAVFNVADSFIVASMGLFIILTLRGTRLDGSRQGKAVPGADASSVATERSDSAVRGDADEIDTVDRRPPTDIARER